jgi:hypothetical protein
MNGTIVLVFAALVVLLVFITYAVVKDPSWSKKSYWMANFVENPWTVYGRSTGVFDAAASLALRRATGRTHPTPGDHILAATVITRNILAQEHRPAVDAAGDPTPAAVEQATLRREMFDEARGHYMGALDGLLEPPRAGGGNPFDLNIDFIIDAAATFAYRGIADMLANDPILAAMGENFQLVQTIHFGPNNEIMFVDEPMAEAATQRRADLVAARQAAALKAAEEQGGARGAAVDAYVGLATQNTDDPQNTHDPGVLACLRSIVLRLRSDQSEVALPTVDEIVAEIRKRGESLSDSRAHRVNDVVAVIDRIRLGERVVAVSATDEECLRRVWQRTEDPRNIDVRMQLKQAVFDALYDSWEEGIDDRAIVCVNGRTSRLLSSLVLLDWDKRNWEVKKLEQFKNDIFAAAAQVIDESARAAAASADAGQAAAGKLYLARTAAELEAVGEVPADAEDHLANAMRDAIRKMVDEYVAREVAGAVPSYLVSSIKEDACAAVC